MNRREFIGGLALSAVLRPGHSAASPFPVQFRRASPYQALTQYIEPGNDSFQGEKEAMEIASALRHLTERRSLPLDANFHGRSPLPVRYRSITEGVLEAEFGTATE